MDSYIKYYSDLLYLTCWVSLSSLSVEEGKLSNEILDFNTSVQVVRFAFQLFGIKKKKYKKMKSSRTGGRCGVSLCRQIAGCIF